MHIEIQPYNPDWPARFAALAAKLRPGLPQNCLIHHIGSTAVPGLAAKDIIDIQITVPSLTQFNPTPLLDLGLTLRPPIRDHMPPGLNLPDADLAKRMLRSTSPAANIHIREQGRFNQRYPLLCRDYLRTHPQTAAAYATIKHHLARHFPNDAEAYYDIKDPVFDLIMAAAEPWAASNNWTIPASN